MYSTARNISLIVQSAVFQSASIEDSIEGGRYDIQQTDTQHNDTQRVNNMDNIHPNDTELNDTQLIDASEQ